MLKHNKKNPERFCLQFSCEDDKQYEAIMKLNQMGRTKSKYIADAIAFFEHYKDKVDGIESSGELTPTQINIIAQKVAGIMSFESQNIKQSSKPKPKPNSEPPSDPPLDPSQDDKKLTNIIKEQASTSAQQQTDTPPPLPSQDTNSPTLSVDTPMGEEAMRLAEETLESFLG